MGGRDWFTKGWRYNKVTVSRFIAWHMLLEYHLEISFLANSCLCKWPNLSVLNLGWLVWRSVLQVYKSVLPIIINSPAICSVEDPILPEREVFRSQLICTVSRGEKWISVSPSTFKVSLPPGFNRPLVGRAVLQTSS